MDQNDQSKKDEMPKVLHRLPLSPITPDQAAGKNLDGSLGKICNNCGGLGWTMVLTGGKKNCDDCDKTGIATMSRRELQMELEKQRDMIAQMIQHLIDEGVILKGLRMKEKNV